MKVKLPYKTSNNISYLIVREQANLMEKTGISYKKKDIMTKIGDHCGVGWEAIKRISYGMAQPSLPLAMKIAEYFNTTVEDIYKLEDGEWGD